MKFMEPGSRHQVLSPRARPAARSPGRTTVLHGFLNDLLNAPPVGSQITAGVS
jgi:hypothetical protein